jgi:uncharacterized repeat protein (TIGR01451 family)
MMKTQGRIMKKQWLIGTGILVATALMPINGAPAIASVINAGTNVAQNILRQPKVTLNLVAEQQVVSKNAQGEVVQTWQATGGKAKVKSGDILRFTVSGKNEGTKAAQNFAVTQPVPRGTVLALNSAQASTPASVVYSIDQGKTFVAQPVVKVALADGKVVEKPAPAEAYTHVRWQMPTALEPNANVATTYQVTVR